MELVSLLPPGTQAHSATGPPPAKQAELLATPAPFQLRLPGGGIGGHTWCAQGIPRALISWGAG